MYNNNNRDDSGYPHNGSRRSMQSPFSEDQDHGFSSPFSEENLDPHSDDRRSQPLSPQGKQNLRLLQRFYITLIVTGVVIGGILTLGIASLMNQWDLIDPPTEQQFKN